MARSALAGAREFAVILTGVVLVIYLLATCVSGLFSSHRCINVFGVRAFVLAIAAYRVSVDTFVSGCGASSPPS